MVRWWEIVELLVHSKVDIRIHGEQRQENNTLYTSWAVTIDGIVRSQGMASAEEAIRAAILDVVINHCAKEG